jgi:hypothetical protein
MEENRFCEFSPDSPLGFFVTHHFGDTSFWWSYIHIKRSHKPLFMVIFKKDKFFWRAVIKSPI